MKPSICNNKRSPVTPDNCPSKYWLVRVNDLSEIREVSFNHAYILPDNSIWVWSHDESRLILLNGAQSELRLEAGDNITLERDPETGVITINSTCCYIYEDSYYPYEDSYYSYEDSYYTFENTGWINIQPHNNFRVEGILKMRVLSGVLYLAGTDIRFIGGVGFTMDNTEIFRIPPEIQLPFAIEFPVSVGGEWWSSPTVASIRITQDGVANITHSPYGIHIPINSLLSFVISIPLGDVQYGQPHNDATRWFVGELDDE